MSKKDYINLAMALRATRRYIESYIPDGSKEDCYVVLETAMWNIADACALDNSRFSRERFKAAVGFMEE